MSTLREIVLLGVPGCSDMPGTLRHVTKPCREVGRGQFRKLDLSELLRDISGET